MKSRIHRWITLMGVVSALLPGICGAGLYGNNTAATARPIMADGTAYIDQMTLTNVNAWFVFRMDPDQSYSVEVWNPYGPQDADGNLCVGSAVYEADGTTLVNGIGGQALRSNDLPAPMVGLGVLQGSRWALIASGSARRATVQIGENGEGPATPTDCAIRVVTTTLASPRWSVNGYSDFIAVSNTSTTVHAGSGVAIHGAILYFDESGAKVGSDPFTLAPNGSIQIVKSNGVAIGGALKGGIRIVHDGAPGTIIAHQLWYNPVTNAYIQYPFVPLVHSYGRGGI